MITTLIILILSAVFSVNGKLHSDFVALHALVLLVAFNIPIPEETPSGSFNPVVITMVGLFAIGGAIFKTGSAKIISNKILHLVGKDELKLFILIMMATALVGAFVSNTGTVALILLIVVSATTSANISPGGSLIPLASAGSMDGVATPIGTPPNLMADKVLPNTGFANPSLLSFTPIEVICMLIGLVVLIPLSKFFLVKKKDSRDMRTTTGHSPKELARKYQLSDNLYRIQIRPGPRIGGKKL